MAINSDFSPIRKAIRDYTGQGIAPTPSMLKSELLPTQPIAEINENRLLVKDVFEEFIHYSQEKKKGECAI